MSITVASTGGIGSGKSYVSHLFQALGLPLYFADDRAKELYLENRELADSLSTLLGEAIVKSGVLQREMIAAKIFSDSTLLSKVNSLVHPVVLKDFIEWREKQRSKGAPLVVIESAIILTIPSLLREIDKIVVVHAPLQIRRERVMRRDRLTAIEFDRRVNNQPSDNYFLERADFVIDSSGAKGVLPQLLNILKRLGIEDGQLRSKFINMIL
ncbi:MAG: dephospho-CoA kinase [Bacteroidales bacterium]